MATVVTVPFVNCILRKKIDFKMLQRALEKVFPKAGKELVTNSFFSCLQVLFMLVCVGISVYGFNAVSKQKTVT